MIDLLVRALHAMGEKRDDMGALTGIDRLEMISPFSRLGGISAWRRRRRRLVEIERGRICFGQPAALQQQLAIDDLALVRRPCHLLDWRVFGEPDTRRLQDRLAGAPNDRVARLIHRLAWGDARIDAAGGQRSPAWV